MIGFIGLARTFSGLLVGGHSGGFFGRDRNLFQEVIADVMVLERWISR